MQGSRKVFTRSNLRVVRTENLSTTQQTAFRRLFQLFLCGYGAKLFTKLVKFLEHLLADSGEVR